ncbi:AAA family ATPase [Haloarculaceae archaeon H-GB2-1]|nr:AAA family ATPase [Haloarculaceae archaeon H-GB1-1]MEA5387735.1 AAA family ATPase [Haloarculaceae archaeon H-GB11]MEA5409226.1 AAA family ATPase [Haloarculaceae archaeon H-GB2-1]
MTDSSPAAPSGQSDTALSEVEALADRIIENVQRVIVGHRPEVVHVLTALFGRGHVLVEDVPGVGKTMLARAIAQSFDGDFERVQFTPDMLPSDVTGVNVYDEHAGEFEFRPGPVFANVVLADEINRAPPKTQSSLLEAMEEAQVTVDGETHVIPQPFTVIATQNDVERGPTYELPLAQRDRFTKKLRLGYPEEADETALLGRLTGHHPIGELSSVATVADLRDARDAVSEVYASEEIRSYVTRLARFTRTRADIGVSPRGSLAALRAAQARAALDGRDYVIPDDVQTEVPVVFPHRIRLGSGYETATDLVEEALTAVSID